MVCTYKHVLRPRRPHTVPDTGRQMPQQLPAEIMKKAAKGISYIAHPLRLRILEYLDVNGASSVSAVTKALNEEQVIVSQSFEKTP